MTGPVLTEPGKAIGLVAGAGRFPILFAQKAKELGIPVVCVGIAGMADPALIPLCVRFRWLRRMAMGQVLREFHRGNVHRWTMAGKFHKHILFHPWRWLQFLPDWRTVRFWYSRTRSDNRDDSLLLGLIAMFREEGFECVSALEVVPELLVRAGVLTQRAPTQAEERDIRFGWAMAKEMGRLDVGQSAMVRERVIIAVEAIEGTERAIVRAGELAGRNGFIVVKVAKPQQDMRFDMPTIGKTTIETMRQAGGSLLAIEAGKTLILDESETIALANKYKIAITALPSDWLSTDPEPR